MTDRSQLEYLFAKFQEPGELSIEDQNSLDELLGTPEGRQQWVQELSFQADLIDILKTEKELQEAQKSDASKIIPISSAPIRKASPATMPPSLRYAGWLALAAVLMMALFLSYNINGLPGKSNHTVLGKVIALQGEVHLSRGPLNVELIPNMNFKEGDRLLTSKNGVVVFEYDDGSRISIAPNSRLAFATQKQKKQEGWSIGLDKGIIDAEIQPQQQKLRVKTPKIGIEVLGTQFSVNSQAGQQEVQLYEGKLSVVHLEDKNKQHLLMSGQGLISQADTIGLKSFLLQPSSKVSGKVLAINSENNLITVETSTGTLHLRWRNSNVTSFKLANESPALKNNLKTEQSYIFKIQGLACPQIISFNPITK